MEPTYDADRVALEPLEKFKDGLDKDVPDLREGARPGAKVKLRVLIRADIIRAALEILTGYKPLVAVTLVRNQYATEIEKHEAVRNETWIIAQEMSHLIQAKAARHPILEDWLQPKIGNTPDDRATNIANMANRVATHKADLARVKIELGLWPAHSLEHVTTQVARDGEAAKELTRINEQLGADEKKRIEYRAKAEKLQPKINSALENAVGSEDRALLVSLGFQEKATTKSKPHSKAEGKSEAKGEAKTDAQAPAKPGPVASGTTGAAPAAKSDDGKTDAAPSSEAAQEKPQGRTEK